MRETEPAREGSCEGLTDQALLYLNDEMDAADAAAFERRLGGEQQTREALAQAALLASALSDHGAAPHPSYREAVRRRLQPAGCRAWLTGRRPYRGHPALWTLLGAAAAVLLMFGLARGPFAAPPGRPDIPPVAETAPAAAPDAEPTPAAAHVWAELNNSDHLSRARVDAQKRKVRTEVRRPTPLEERAARFVDQPMVMPH